MKVQQILRKFVGRMWCMGGVVWGRLSDLHMGFQRIERRFAGRGLRGRAWEVDWQGDQTKPGAGKGLEGAWEEAGKAGFALRKGQNRLEGPEGFLSAANRAKSPLWDKLGGARFPIRCVGQSPLWEGWEGPGFYPPRIGQTA